MIRIATFPDANTIAQLHANSWQKAYRGILTDDFLDNAVQRYQQKLWQAALKQPPGNHYTAVFEEENSVIGFIHVVWQKDSVYGTYIDNLHVATNSQGKGVGKSLMQHISSEVESRFGERHFYLWVLEKNAAACVFYERMGGKLVETTSDIMPDGQYHSIHRYYWEHFNAAEQYVIL